MASSDRDVFVCYGGQAGSDLAKTISAGLARKGFRVADGSGGAAAADAGRLRQIEQTPDFVVVLTPETLEALASEDDPIRAAVSHALAHRRNVVQVRGPGAVSERAEDAAAALFALRNPPVVEYNPARRAESIALIGHRLSSDATVDERRLMRRSKRLFALAGAILLTGVALQEVPRLIERWTRPRLLSPIAPFALYWAGFGLSGGGDGRTFPVGRQVEMKAGDQLRLVFSPSADGHAYVVSRNVRGDVAVLFPTDAVRGASRVLGGRTYFAPVGSGWLKIEDEASAGTIYLVAGYDPVQNFEELVEEPTATASSRRALLDLTMAGLLDGRHGAAERRVWTGKLHPIDPAIAIGAGPASTEVVLAGGRRVTGALAAQPGLVSSSVEIKIEYRAQ
jgi:hypothetical protein